ncbi:MAG: hypothetical protein AAGA17_00780 [Actinomycetota bacterium]
MRRRLALWSALVALAVPLVVVPAGASHRGGAAVDKAAAVAHAGAERETALAGGDDGFRAAAVAGYWMVDAAGGVVPFGGAAYYGEPETFGYGGYPDCSEQQLGELGFCDLVVDIESTPTGDGYWLLDTEGYVWAFGDAVYLGDAGAVANDPALSITSTASGQGYWVFTLAGCVLTFGDATWHGDMCGRQLNAGIVGSAVTPSGNGYYLLGSDGGVFSFGDAEFHGSTGSLPLNEPVVGMAVTETGGGYWLVATDGGIFAFGDARFAGSMGSTPLNAPVIDMVGSPTGGGYLMVAIDGGIFSFGDVPFHGSLGGLSLPAPVTSVATLPA